MSTTATNKPESRTEEFSDRIKKYPKEEFEPYSVDGDVIGCGGYGKVRKYRHKNKIVAIKEFIIAGDDEAINNIWNTLLQEANILCRFHHKNIVEILGITHWTDGVGIIMEYVDGGNLQTLLSIDNKRELSWNNRLEIAKGITSGLDYIHNYGEKKTFCHGDLKPANVLLTSDLQVKLADFGSAAFHRATGASSTTANHFSTTQFTLIYVAPEFLEDNTHERNPAMDMYSFGMVLYELISGSPPYSDCSLPEHVPALILAKIKPSAKLIDGVENQLKSDDDQEAFNFLKNLMKKCWNDHPTSRLSSSRAKLMLSSYLKQGSSSPIDDFEKFSDDDEREDRADYIIPKKSDRKTSTLEDASKTIGSDLHKHSSEVEEIEEIMSEKNMEELDPYRGAGSIEDNFNAKSHAPQSLIESYKSLTFFGSGLQKQSTGGENIEDLRTEKILEGKGNESFQDVLTIENSFTSASLSLLGSNKSSASFGDILIKESGSDKSRLEKNSERLVSQKKSSKQVSRTKVHESASQVDRFPSHLRQYPCEEFEVKKGIIGSGGFAVVWKCHHKELNVVAIKQFAITDHAEIIRNVKIAPYEASILCQYNHQNIVKCLGVTQWPNAVGIILEFVDGGNLHEFLSKSVESDLSWETRLQIAIGIVAALSYIHNFATAKLHFHGDIKPCNVLLTKKLQVKLADFGSAALYRSTGTPSTTPELEQTKQFTLAYVAPEFLEDTSREKNPAMDVYSFGMILYEMICRQPPYSDSSIHKFVPSLILAKIKPSGKLIDEVESQLKSNKDRLAFLFLKNMMERCSNSDPASRPSSKTVERELKDFLTKFQQLSTPLGNTTEPISDESASQITRCEPDSATALNHSKGKAKTVSSVHSFEAEISSRLSKNPNDEREVHQEERDLFGKSKYLEFGKFHDKIVKIFTIKRVSIASGAKTAIETWNMIENEANLLLQFRHPNLVEVLEIVEMPNALGIVMEYVDGGNLRERLSKCSHSNLSWENRVKIAQELVSALSYIHHYADIKKLCHGYIKSENVLLRKGLGVKLANFGTDSFMRTTTDTTMTSELIPTKEQTMAYVAPEFLLDPTQSKNPAMDMYSFGSVLYELICTKPPYHDCTEQLSLMLNLIRDGQKPDMKAIYQKRKELQTVSDRAAFHLLKTLMLRCWNADPAARPCSKQVEGEINNFLEKQQQNPSSSVRETERFVAELPLDGVEVDPGGVAARNEQVTADTKATTDGLSTASTETENAAISKNISSVIGPNGGVIEGGGCRLVFPKGALKSEVPIKLYSTYGGNDVMEGLATTLLRCEPSGQKFNKKILFRLYTCYITDEPAFVQVRRSKDGKHWENIKQFRHTDERYFEFSIKGFSWFAVVYENIRLWLKSEKRKCLTSWTPLSSCVGCTKILRCFVDDDVPDVKRKLSNPEDGWELTFIVKDTEDDIKISLTTVVSLTTEEDDNQGSNLKITPSFRLVKIFRLPRSETSFKLRWMNRNDDCDEMNISVQTTEKTAYDQSFYIPSPWSVTANSQESRPNHATTDENPQSPVINYDVHIHNSQGIALGNNSSTSDSAQNEERQGTAQEPSAKAGQAPLPRSLK